MVQKPLSFYVDLLVSEHFALKGFSLPFLTCLFSRLLGQSTTLLAVTWVFAAHVPCERENSWGIASEASLFQRWIRERLLRYFSFKAIFEEKRGRESMAAASCCLRSPFHPNAHHKQEPLQTDRRYMLAVMPHGVIPFASTLDRSCWEWVPI